ncbi:MAG TPA: FAD-dependent monooxygenase [Candidatus Acidoferrales bacterium]|nr:FAD-dependent monooxygenase [Candidatus Acidoferrales bacterium]
MRNPGEVEANPLETDVFVVGGGPAGLAAAIAARQKGFRVSMADSSVPPVDKACGEGLMPDGIAVLRKLGIKIGSAHGLPFRGIRFVEGNLAAQSNLPKQLGWGIRRTTLHILLSERAKALGVDMYWGKRVVGFNESDAQNDEEQREIFLGGRAIHARWIIAADGQNSRVRQWAQFDPPRRKGLRYGFRSHYQITPWSDCVEVHWGKLCQIYVTPVGPREVCVALLTTNPTFRLADALPLFPSLAKHLQGAISPMPEMGGVSSSYSMPAVTRKQVALVGDASGSVDAIAGAGLSLAFQQALSLAGALERNDLTVYEIEHRRTRKRPVMMSRLLVALSHHSRLRHRVLSAFASEPSLFSKLLAVHTGAPVSPLVALQTFASLGQRILIPRKIPKPIRPAPESAISQAG